MAFEHFFWFVDRAIIDPLLDMSWRSYLRKYPRSRRELEQLLTFVVEPEPEPDAVADILARRTLRWTMKRATPAYYFLNDVIHGAPVMRRRSPEVWSGVDETAILVAATCDAFLRRDIDGKTLWAVHNISGGEDLRNWLRLSPSELTQLSDALSHGAVEKPLFPWQSNECLEDGYRVLGATDAKRFLAFLTRAGEENWPAPRIRTDIRRRFEWMGQAVPRFLDVQLTKKLVRCVNTMRFARPCILRYFG
jgi:hypothetical protein